MLGCVAQAGARDGEGVREFRQINESMDRQALKASWRQSQSPRAVILPPVTIQPMPPGGGSNGGAPPIPGVNSIQENFARRADKIGKVRNRNRIGELPPITTQPIGSGGGSNSGAPPITGVNDGSGYNSHGNRNGRSVQINQSGNTLSINGVDLNLSSGQLNIKLGNRLFRGASSVTIDVGGGSKTLTAGSEVTAAEYVAARQVLSAGSQQLILDNAGTAVGGTVDFSTVSSRGERIKIDDLSIPINVSAFGDFSKTPLFSVSGDLINAGTVYAYSSGNNAHRTGFSADNITNESSGLITSKLPIIAVKRGGSTRSNQPIDLSLHADDTLSNFGTISSSGELVITAGHKISNVENGVVSAQGAVSLSSSNIINAGLISSADGGVSIDGANTAVLQVTNTRGTIVARSGDINVRNSSYDGVLNTYFTGGNLYSKAVNVNAGQGSAEIDVDDLTGTLNQKGVASHVATNTSTLKLGEICLTGDPTYSNTGNISLDGNITVGEDLTIIASGDITASVPLTLTANSATQGFNITLIAGADISAGGGSSAGVGPVPPPATSVQTTISGNSSVTGGNIILGVNGAVNINASPTAKTAANGGNVTLAAFMAAGANGSIQHTLGSITSGGKGTGTNGDVTIIAGSQVPAFDNSISSINSSGGTGGGGNISFVSDQPSAGAAITYLVDGSGSGVLTPAGTTNAGVSTTFRGQLTAGGNVSIDSGTIKWLPASKVGISTNTTTGSINLISRGSTGIQIGNGNFFSTNKLTVDAGTGDIGQSGLVAMQTNAAKIIANGDTGFSEIAIVSSNKGLVLFNGSADTLNLSSAGTFMTDPSLAPITANTAFLGSFAAGTGLNAFNPVEVAVDNLFITAGSKGNVFAHNSNATTTTLLGTEKMVANKTFSLISDNDLAMLPGAFIAADNVILTTAGSFNSLGGTIDGDVSVTLTSDGTITTSAVPGSILTPLLKLISVNGGIGTSTGSRYVANTGTLAVTATAANGSVFLQGLAGKSFQVVGGLSSGVFDYFGPGSTTFSGNITSGNNSDINLVIGTGTLTTKAAQIHSGRNILMQVADNASTKIKIVLGVNTDIFTDSNPSFGDITIALGNVTQVTGTPPGSGVSFAEFGAGADIFWGTAGISGKGQNFVIAQGADVTFSNSISSKAISLAGNVQITADPPLYGSETFVGGGSSSTRSGSSGFSNARFAFDSQAANLTLTRSK